MDGWMNDLIDEWMDRWLNEWIDRQWMIDGWMDGIIADFDN